MRLIRLKEVKHVTGLGRSTIYKYIEDGVFPKSVSLGERAVAWVESEVMAWVMTRIEARDRHYSLAVVSQLKAA
ncbi:AlpA family transcriptional regulator [Pseudomonas sp. CCI1.2]|uniref:AlpA family transcriptional regulator n=1 Tax=Pseudomonas sp. CCI1.2 TaxID=3048614 RepID=UPI002B228A2C|nr:AlpA family transcriptional regulator [Pseudomonas sp. CCI1.2]MEB0121613.1 AlpA family transcriptional regulator [Pseudomonas sp. CCI1.2]